jgi:hypothetical protein
VVKGTLPGGLSLNAATGVIAGQPTVAGAFYFAIKIRDSLYQSAVKGFALTIDPALVITTSSPLPPGTVRAQYAETLTATGGSGQYIWAVSAGTLPGGLSLDAATGAISGLPTTAETSKFGIRVTASHQRSVTKAFAMTVNPELVITTTSPLPAGAVGANYAQSFAATGGSGQYTWALSAGSLPHGLSLNAATGAIGGQASAAGKSEFGIEVTDSNAVTTMKGFALTIGPALLITTTSPLPAATAGAGYSQAFAATGGAGGYSWSATGLPTWLSLSTAGVLTGSAPLTAVDASFTVRVTDSNNNSISRPFTLPVTLAIITASPLPAGQVGVNYSQTLAAVGGTGTYTWSVSLGSLPGGLSLTPSTGVIAGQPATAANSNFTIQVQDGNRATATQPFTVTINPAASIQTLSPNSSNAGLSLQVSVTGSYTHFVQGATVANFGPGIAVGGATVGQPGPVTVTGAASATAQIAISASAATGSQTVTVTTGAEQAALANGFTIQAAIPYISLDTTTTVPLAAGFSGFDDEYLLNGVEYWDPKYLPMVKALHPGWVRFPSGTLSMPFDWQTGYLDQSWMAELQPEVIPQIYSAPVTSQQLTQAKCGASFSKYGTFLQTLGANGVVVFNGYTDTLTDSAGKMVTAAQAAGLNILEWELANEPFLYPKIFASPGAYVEAQYKPYYVDMAAANPGVNAGVFYQGQFIFQNGNYKAWDGGTEAIDHKYWQAVSFHVYPIGDVSMSAADEEMTLNGVLAYGTTAYFSSYILPLLGPNVPVYFTEMNTGAGAASMPFESTIYNGIFLAEYVARMSTISQIQAVGVTELYLGNSFNASMIRAVDDYEQYLIAQVEANPNYCTDTSTNPNTQFSFYFSAPGLAMTVANLAINNSQATWPTTLTGQLCQFLRWCTFL